MGFVMSWQCIELSGCADKKRGTLVIWEQNAIVPFRLRRTPRDIQISKANITPCLTQRAALLGSKSQVDTSESMYKYLLPVREIANKVFPSWTAGHGRTSKNPPSPAEVLPQP